MHFPVFLLIFIIPFVSCSPAPVETQEVTTASTDSILPGAVFTRPDTVPAPPSFILTDTFVRVEILNQGSYHGDEVEEGIEQGEWFSLFLNQGYFIEKTSVTASRVYDAVLDEDESVATGWEIEDGAGHDPIIMVKGTELPEEEILNVQLPAQILPGDTAEFMYNESYYYLFASGNNIRDEASGEIWTYSDYRLFLSTEKNGKQITQQLVYFDFFDEAMVSILFCGDIDGDTFPDFLIDNVYKYNSRNPTLYLSGETGDDELLHLVGWRKTYGC